MLVYESSKADVFGIIFMLGVVFGAIAGFFISWMAFFMVLCSVMLQMVFFTLH